MKAAGFWILMFCLLAVMAYLTLYTNPQRSKYRHPAEEARPPAAESSETREKTWSKVYAELYGPKGLEKTWEIATPKGYFTQADRDQFVRDIPAKKQFGEAQVTAKEDGDDLVFSIYYKGAKP
ncbi:MAG TPA: hypothetical protein VMN77_09900 [Nitrospiria bacterium]|jgi:hypothetical protein|nr:hypothetical protein [Nitrospiria bacterium]